MVSLEKIDDNNFVIKGPSEAIHSSGKRFRHLNYIWKIKSSHNSNVDRSFLLTCYGPANDLWNIDASVTFDVKNGRFFSKTINTCFNRSNPTLKCILEHKMNRDEFIKSFPNLEVRVTINSITGVERDFLLMDFETENELSDVALVVEGKKLYVNKAVLATFSPVFSAMFFSGFKESTDKEVVVNDVKHDDFKIFLLAIHSAENYIKSSNIEEMLILADRYDVRIVMKKCEKYLLSTDHFPVAEKLRLAEIYTLPTVHQKCMGSMDTKEKLALLCENTSKFGPMTLQAIIRKTKDLQN